MDDAVRRVGDAHREGRLGVAGGVARADAHLVRVARLAIEGGGGAESRRRAVDGVRRKGVRGNAAPVAGGGGARLYHGVRGHRARPAVAAAGAREAEREGVGGGCACVGGRVEQHGGADGGILGDEERGGPAQHGDAARARRARVSVVSARGDVARRVARRVGRHRQRAPRRAAPRDPQRGGDASADADARVGLVEGGRPAAHRVVRPRGVPRERVADPHAVAVRRRGAKVGAAHAHLDLPRADLCDVGARAQHRDGVEARRRVRDGDGGRVHALHLLAARGAHDVRHRERRGRG